jgi:hypothetical protein
MDENHQDPGGDKPRHYNGSSLKQVKPTWPWGIFSNNTEQIKPTSA